MIIHANETPGFQFKRFALLGMSGLGKTFISRTLVKQDDWLHYSVDYEIGKILFKNRLFTIFNKNWGKKCIIILFLPEELL